MKYFSKPRRRAPEARSAFADPGEFGYLTEPSPWWAHVAVAAITLSGLAGVVGAAYGIYKALTS